VFLTYVSDSCLDPEQQHFPVSHSCVYSTVSLLNTACCEKINGDDNDADDDELRIKAILIQTVDYYAAKSSLINFIIALILIDLNNFYRPTVVA